MLRGKKSCSGVDTRADQLRTSWWCPVHESRKRSSPRLVAVLSQRAVHRARVVHAVARAGVVLTVRRRGPGVEIEVRARRRADAGRDELQHEALRPPERRREADGPAEDVGAGPRRPHREETAEGRAEQDRRDPLGPRAVFGVDEGLQHFDHAAQMIASSSSPVRVIPYGREPLDASFAGVD